MKFDGVVIGASTAGLIAAETLARSGHHVALFERAKALNPAARTYIVTPGLLRVLPDLDQKLIRHKIHRFSLQANDRSTEIALKSPDLVIERSELISSLYQRALDAGVEIFFDSRFIGLTAVKNHPELRIDIEGIEQVIRGGYLIGADGANSEVRKNIQDQRVPSVPLLQAEIDLPADWDADLTKVWFDPGQTSYFYWLIPDKDHKAVVGLIADPGADIHRKLVDFAESHSFSLGEYQSGTAALYSRSSQDERWIGELRIMFIGDAAGQVKVTTVGGTVTGLQGGKAAAEAVLTGDPYSKKLGRVRRELELHHFIRRLMDRMSVDDYENLIGSITPQVEHLLSSHDRDGMRSHFWKLPFLQPVFIPLGLKLLIKSMGN